MKAEIRQPPPASGMGHKSMLSPVMGQDLYDADPLLMWAEMTNLGNRSKLWERPETEKKLRKPKATPTGYKGNPTANVV